MRFQGFRLLGFFGFGLGVCWVHAPAFRTLGLGLNLQAFLKLKLGSTVFL